MNIGHILLDNYRVMAEGAPCLLGLGLSFPWRGTVRAFPILWWRDHALCLAAARALIPYPHRKMEFRGQEGIQAAERLLSHAK